MGDPILGWALETWALALLLLALLMLYGIWPYNFFKKLGIPGPRPLPFIGNLHEYKNGIFNFDQRCFEKYGKIWGIFEGRQPVMAIMDSTLIKTIMVKEFYTYFTNHRDFGLKGNMDSIITLAVDEQWKRIRNAFSPTFTSGRLKEMMPIINHYNEILEKNIQKKLEKDEIIDVKLIFSGYCLDVVTSISFSVDIDSLNHPDDPVVVHIKKFLKFNFLNPGLILSVLEKLNFTMFPDSSVDFFLKVFKKIKEDRQKGHTNRVDFLQLMMDAQTAANNSGDAEKALTDKEIFTQSLFFVFGGYELIGISLSFMSYCLAMHPDVQEKLYQEINYTFPNQTPPTYDALHQMEYLDMVVNETFRLYTPGSRVDRLCKKTVEIHGVTIPEGTVVMIPMYVLHRAPEYWSEPEEYRPERFSKENKESLDPYAFLPFGVGPRSCIATRFALLVLKMGVVVVLQRFHFQTCKETPGDVVFDWGMHKAFRLVGAILHFPNQRKREKAVKSGKKDCGSGNSIGSAAFPEGLPNEDTPTVTSWLPYDVNHIQSASYLIYEVVFPYITECHYS